jgi:hypothetical protein
MVYIRGLVLRTKAYYTLYIRDIVFPTMGDIVLHTIGGYSATYYRVEFKSKSIDRVKEYNYNKSERSFTERSKRILEYKN